MFRILILEDEENARNHLIKALKGLEYDLELLEASTGAEALHLAKDKNIDLFFLDIGIKDMSGMKVAQELRNMKKYELSYIVFITAYGEHMLSAFKQFHCYDFLEKPFFKKEVIELTDLLLGNLQNKKKETPASIKKTLALELKNCTLRIPTEEILFVEMISKACLVHTKDTSYDVPHTSLRKIKALLTEENFVQTHKAFLINIHHIKSIEKQTDTISEIYFKNYKKPALLSKKFGTMLFHERIGEKLYE